MYDLSVSLERMSPRLSGRAGLSRRPLTASAVDQAMFVDRVSDSDRPDPDPRIVMLRQLIEGFR